MWMRKAFWSSFFSLKALSRYRILALNIGSCIQARIWRIANQVSSQGRSIRDVPLRDARTHRVKDNSIEARVLTKPPDFLFDRSRISRLPHCTVTLHKLKPPALVEDVVCNTMSKCSIICHSVRRDAFSMPVDVKRANLPVASECRSEPGHLTTEPHFR